jgi:hypothetical protein
MTEMEERVAGAIMRAYFSRPVDEQTGINVSVRDQMDLARAAIAEMREPTDVMHEAGNDEMDGMEVGNGHAFCEHIWRAMIDAARTTEPVA